MNMQSLLKQAKKMQGDIVAKEEEFKQKEFTHQQGGGAISVSMLGSYELTNISISEELLNVDGKEDLEMMIKATINELTASITKEKEEMMKDLTGGISLPGGF